MNPSRHRRTVASALLVAAVAAPSQALPVVAGGTDAVKRTQPRALADTERRLTLQQAIAGALEKNDAVLIERAAVDSGEAATVGARGAYDPVVAVEVGRRSVTAPVNSAFSGAPDGESAPTDRTAELGASLQQLLPTGGLVSVTAGGSRATTDGAFTLLSPAYQAQLGVELRQPLLRDRGIDAARLSIRVAAVDRSRAEASLRQVVIETVSAVERAYWRLVATRGAVRVQEDAVGLASQQLEETESRISSGSAPETEIAQPRAELERRRGDLLAAHEAAARAETSLKTLILGDETTTWAERLVPIDEIDVEPVQADPTVAMEEALASRPELQVAAADLARRGVELTFARDRVRPALDLVVSYDRFGLAGARNPAGSDIPGLSGDVPPGLAGNFGDAVGQLSDGDFQDARVAIQLQLPIGNRTAHANARIAANAQVQAEAGVAQLRKAIRAEVLDAIAATDTASGRIEAARAARQAAEVQLSAEQDRFEAGLSTNFLVLTRQNDLAAARLAEIEALTDYRTARTDLARAKGVLLEERRVELE